MLQFYHLADIHFGVSFNSRSESTRSKLRLAQMRAFEKMVDTALEEKIDGILIAGDLFDKSSIDPKTENFIYHQAKRCNDADIPIYCIEGNHDFNILWDRSFVKVLSSELEILENDRFRIVGQSFESPSDIREIKNLPTFKDDLPTIGLFHTSLNTEGYMPSLLSAFVDAGYDYVALGHIHTKASYFEGRVQYPGSFFPVNSNETGDRGYLKVRLGETLQTEFVPSTDVQFQKFDLTLSNEEGFRTNLYNKLKELSEQSTFSKVYLHGALLRENRLSLKQMLDDNDFSDAIEIIDETTLMSPIPLEQNPFLRDLLVNLEGSIKEKLQTEELFLQSREELEVALEENPKLVESLLYELFIRGEQ
ncbi:metallophosphoesterase family protein [Guggenheimella bovis]